MTSDKSDVAYPSPKKAKFEQLRADHELFLRTFESKTLPVLLVKCTPLLVLMNFLGFFLFKEPTQIYRFLRTRNAVAVSGSRSFTVESHNLVPRHTILFECRGVATANSLSACDNCYSILALLTWLYLTLFVAAGIPASYSDLHARTKSQTAKEAVRTSQYP